MAYLMPVILFPAFKATGQCLFQFFFLLVLFLFPALRTVDILFRAQVAKQMIMDVDN